MPKTVTRSRPIIGLLVGLDDSSSYSVVSSIAQGRPSHGGNEAGIFILAILGRKFFLPLSGEENLFVILGGKEDWGNVPVYGRRRGKMVHFM